MSTCNKIFNLDKRLTINTRLDTQNKLNLSLHFLLIPFVHFLHQIINLILSS